MNILVVDDDKFVIQKIVEGIDWEEIGIKRVFTADNVRQARKIFETFPVDILVTDIEMPQGSGLELLEWVKSKNYPVESLVLSGYAHFAYAQKAMQYGGRDYMLKPISNRELSEVIRNIVREKQSRNSLVRESRGHFESWKRAVGGAINTLRITPELRSLCSPNDSFCLEILRNLSDTGKNDTELRLVNFVLRNVIQEFFENRGLELEYAGQLHDSEWLVVFRENGRLSSIGEYTCQMQECLREVVQLDFCVYLGKIGTLDELPGSYDALQRILKEAIPNGQGIFLEGDWDRGQEQACVLPDFRVLTERMSTDIPAVKEELLAYIRELSESHSATQSVFQAFIDGLLTMINQNLADRNILRSRIFDEREYEEGYRRAFLSVPWMEEWISYLFDKLDGYQYSSRKQEYIVEKLKRYIEDHLEADLSRKELSKIVYLSEDYLSKIFAAETGSSISNYVTGRRIARARQYLAETSMSVSQIAMKVGYSNFSYFSKSFRDLTGKTPNEYRNSVKNQSSPK